MFDECLNHFARKNIIDIEKVNEYKIYIDESINKFLKKINITDEKVEEFKKCNIRFDSISSHTGNKGFFYKIKNGFLILCSKMNITMSPKLHIMFGILQYWGDMICNHKVSIEILLEILKVMYKCSNVDTKNMMQMIDIYCSINRDIKHDKLLKLLYKEIESKRKDIPKEQNKKYMISIMNNVILNDQCQKYKMVMKIIKKQRNQI